MEIIDVCEVLILNNSGQILLQLRDNNPAINGSGKWGVIGGRREGGESVAGCIAREVEEELSIILEPIFYGQINDYGDNKLYRHFIFIHTFLGNEQTISLKEGQKIQFFRPKTIASLEKVEWFDRVYAPIIKNL